MKISRSALADLTEIVSSVAILVTLVYLTIEINQNTSAMNAQTRQAVLDAAQFELQMTVERPQILRNITGSHSLTEEEQIQIDSLLTLTLRAREFSWLQFQDGTIDELQWNTEYAVLKSLLDSDRSRLWWNNLGRYVFGGEFVEFVDQTLEENPATNRILQSSSTWLNSGN